MSEETESDVERSIMAQEEWEREQEAEAREVRAMPSKFSSTTHTSMGPSNEAMEAARKLLAFVDLSQLNHPAARHFAVAEALDAFAAEAVKDQPKSEAMRALEDLTPGGSEYVDDIEACVAHIRRRFGNAHEMKKRYAKACNFKGRVLEALTPGAGAEPLDDDEMIEMIVKLRDGVRAEREAREVPNHPFTLRQEIDMRVAAEKAVQDYAERFDCISAEVAEWADSMRRSGGKRHIKFIEGVEAAGSYLHDIAAAIRERGKQ